MAKGIIKRKLIGIGLTVCLLFGVHDIFSQTIQTITGKKDILIGEQITLKVKATFQSEDYQVRNWLIIPDSIPHFEIVEIGKIDSADFKNNSKIVEQVITITSFDSGGWVFPKLPVNFKPLKNDSALNVFTDSFYVNVSYSPPDSINQLRDIKPIINVSLNDYLWYYITGGFVLLLLIVYLLYRYFKKRKKTQPVKKVSALSPFDEALEELKKLNQFDLLNAGDNKMYHLKLSEIFKNYLSRKQHTNLSADTTGDLLINLKSKNMHQEDISKLATALRCMDAVKFAKFLPLVAESENCLQIIKDIIHITENQSSSLKESK